MLGRQTSPGVERMGNRMERQERKNSGDGKPAKAKFDWKLLPDVLALIKPRRWILISGFGLMVINRVSGLVLPASTKYFLDDVILKRQARLLPVIVLVVVTATVIQGLTSYALTQLLSKSSWRMISELREKVQAHIGRLPVSFYDANKTGMLVSRIMSDVEGVRNLIGTGLVEFAGGIMTAVFALVYLLRISASMTAVAFVVLIVFGLALNRAFKTIRPIFRARPKINAEVTGRLTESLGGVRVVKGYHAEAREEKVFGGRRAAAAGQRAANADRDFVDEPFGHQLDGNRQRDDHVPGRAAHSGGHDDAWGFLLVHDVSGISDRARFPDRGHRDADHRSSGRTGAHARSAGRKPRRRRSESPRIAGAHSRRSDFRGCEFFLRHRKGSAARHQFPIRSRAR